MYRFTGVRPISVAAVFRRRSRHGRYMMTTITTVRRNALTCVPPTVTAIWGRRTLAVIFCRGPGTTFLCILSYFNHWVQRRHWTEHEYSKPPCCTDSTS